MLVRGTLEDFVQQFRVDDFTGTTAQVTLVHVFGPTDQIVSGRGRGEQLDEPQFEFITVKSNALVSIYVAAIVDIEFELNAKQR